MVIPLIKYVKDHMLNCVPKWALSYILSKWCGILKRTTLQDVLQYLTHPWYSCWKLLDLSKQMDYHLYTLFILLQNANSIVQLLIFYLHHEFTTFFLLEFSEFHETLTFYQKITSQSTSLNVFSIIKAIEYEVRSWKCKEWNKIDCFC